LQYKNARENKNTKTLKNKTIILYIQKMKKILWENVNTLTQ